MQTAHELFIHELQDMLDAEQKLVEALEARRKKVPVLTCRRRFSRTRRKRKNK